MDPGPRRGPRQRGAPCRDNPRWGCGMPRAGFPIGSDGASPRPSVGPLRGDAKPSADSLMSRTLPKAINPPSNRGNSRTQSWGRGPGVDSDAAWGGAPEELDWLERSTLEGLPRLRWHRVGPRLPCHGSSCRDGISQALHCVDVRCCRGFALVVHVDLRFNPLPFLPQMYRLVDCQQDVARGMAANDSHPEGVSVLCS
jgi:hypothetical protein